MRSWSRLAAVSGAVLLAGCAAAGGGAGGAPGATAPRPACDADNGGLTLPPGFCAVVVADVSRPRHLVVAPNGDVYVSFTGNRSAATPAERGGVVALRDADGDGRAETRAYFGPELGTGIALRDGYLYFATNTAVLRYRLGAGLEPVGKADTLVQGLPATSGELSKSIALGDGGSLFVSIGAASDACQPVGTEAGAVKGEDPCPQLATRAGVWRFSADKLHQTLAQGEPWATGIRNGVAFTWNPADHTLYTLQHGRSMLDKWPGFVAADNLDMPAEEFLRVPQGARFGWPYCFFNPRLNRLVLAPEYGGNGQEAGRCAQMPAPIMAFPAHWGPNDVLFYTGRQFPARYRGGAFIAFHGRGNPAVPERAGYRVVFVPFDGSRPVGGYESFGQGAAGADASAPPRRPNGLAQGPDGSLYIAEDGVGRIWRVMYTGQPGGTGE